MLVYHGSNVVIEKPVLPARKLFAIMLSCFCLIFLTAKEAAADSRDLNLMLYIHKDYFEIWARGGALPKIFCKEADINLAYDEFADYLARIRNRFYESPDINEITIVIKHDMLSAEAGRDKVMNTAKAAVAAGFFEVTGFLMKPEIEPSEDMNEVLEKVPGLKLKPRKKLHRNRCEEQGNLQCPTI